MTEQEKLLITKYDLLFESRLTRVETSLDNLDRHVIELKDDLRWMLRVMFGFGSILLGLMAKGFHWFV